MSAAPTVEFEIQAGFPEIPVVGVDEVGRGCLAGPVVAGALILPSVIDSSLHPWISEISDSKELTPKARERLAPLIESWALAFGVGVASVEEIDRINIYHAAHLAMKRAIDEAGRRLAARAGAEGTGGVGAGGACGAGAGGARSARIAHALIDGNALPKGLAMPATAIVKGDLKCLSIASASIIAKVWRDRHMAELDSAYPEYGFAVHKGYSTPTHSRALKSLGACAIHRRSFAPVAEALGLRAPEASAQAELFGAQARE